MRFSDIAHTCAQNLLRRKSRTILTVLGVYKGQTLPSQLPAARARTTALASVCRVCLRRT